MVIALAGRRVDALAAETQRFPAANAGAVQQQIREFLRGVGARALVCAAACGADILALEVAGELGLQRRIVLPYDRATFKQTSVADRPGDWSARYDRIIQEVAQNGALIELAYDKDSAATFFAVNHDILDEAEQLAIEVKQEVTALAVWDGASRGEEDVTGHFLEEARQRGWRVAEISTV